MREITNLQGQQTWISNQHHLAPLFWFDFILDSDRNWILKTYTENRKFFFQNNLSKIPQGPVTTVTEEKISAPPKESVSLLDKWSNSHTVLCCVCQLKILFTHPLKKLATTVLKVYLQANIFSNRFYSLLQQIHKNEQHGHSKPCVQ